MPKRTCRAVALCVVLAAAPAAAQRGPLQAPLVREGVTEQLSDHVHVIPDGNVPLVPNVTIVTGEQAVLVIDTGLGARNAEAVLREMRKLSASDQIYLATTHVHPEHDLGAHAFPPRTQMIRSQDQVDEIAASGLATAERFASFSPAVAELLEGATFRPADTVFEDEYHVDLGGVQVRMMAMGYNHTRGDIAFFVEPDAVLVSGDVVMSALPAIGGESRLSTWLASLDRFEALHPARIVPSHGPTGDASMIEAYRTYLTAVRDRVRPLKRDGRSLEETTETVARELGDRYPANRLTGAVRAAYADAP